MSSSNAGRPEHHPTEASRGAVTMLAAFRIPILRIAAALRINKDTLYKYYRQELEEAETIVDAAILKAWMKNIQAGKEMTVLRAMESRFSYNKDTHALAALPNVTVIDNIPNQEPPPVLTIESETHEVP